MKQQNIHSVHLFYLGMSRFEEFLPLFQICSGSLLTDKEIGRLFVEINKKVVQIFGEICFNFCVKGTVDLSTADKKYLRKFSSALVQIANKRISLRQRRSLLAKNPKLLRKLCKLSKEKLWGESKK